jgi:hypothetical protein
MGHPVVSFMPNRSVYFFGRIFIKFNCVPPMRKLSYDGGIGIICIKAKLSRTIPHSRGYNLVISPEVVAREGVASSCEISLCPIVTVFISRLEN